MRKRTEQEAEQDRKRKKKKKRKSRKRKKNVFLRILCFPAAFVRVVGKRWKKLSGRERLIVLIPVAAAAAAAGIAIFLNRDLMRYTLGASPCQYYAGTVYHLREGAVLRRTSDDETLLMDDDGNGQEISSLPIYYEGQDMAAMPQNMAYYAPRSGTFGKLSYFTDIQVGKGGVTAARNGKETTLEQGFLYDGEDLYFFLEPMTLSFNGYQISLSAMSYVEARYNSFATVFDYESGEFWIEEPKGEMTAAASAEDYTVSLIGDSVTTHDGTRLLLFTRPELLESVNG